MKSSLRVAACVALAAVAGCGGPGDSEPDAQQASVELKKVETSALPSLGDYLPPLDDGRVEVAPPANWRVMGKISSILCGFTKEKSVRVPAILVKVIDPPTTERFEDVNEENAADFAAAVQETLKNPLEDALPLILGENVFARHVKKAQVNNLPAEVQVLTTVRGGRMYTVELQIRAGTIKQFRDDAYAVAAGMKFTGGASKANAAEPEAAKDDDAKTKATPEKRPE